MEKPDKQEKDRIIGGCYIDGEVICELREPDPEPEKEPKPEPDFEPTEPEPPEYFPVEEEELTV